MHSRQSGAAHVPIMFFIILLIMFLGVLGWAYMTTTENTQVKADNVALKLDIDALKGKNTLWEHYAEDLGRVLDLPGKYEGRSEVSKDIYRNATLDGVVGVVNPADVKKKMEAFGGSIEIGATKGLEDLLSAAVNKVNTHKQRVADITTERDVAMTQKSEVDAGFQRATTEHTTAANTWRQASQADSAAYVASLSQKDGTINSLNQSVNDKSAELATEREARAAEKKDLQNKIGKLTMHNTALVNKDKARNPIDQPDGKVLVAKAGIPNAFISLGRKDMLQGDTIFRVKNRNSDSVKAYAKVVRVEQDKAEVMLSGVVDPLGDAVREGDLLYNELYSPDGSNRRTIYLLGRFNAPYNKPDLELLLKNLGNKVVSKMVPGVDTVILGDNVPNEANDDLTPVTDLPEFKDANNWGVEFVPLRKIRDLIKLQPK